MGDKGVPRTWAEITEEFNAVQAAAGLPLRSSSSLRHQYRKVIAFSGKKGAFSAEEEEVLARAIDELGLLDQPQRDDVWDEVMLLFPDRTKDQLFSFYTERKYKDYPSGAWTPEEREALVNAVPLESVTVPGDPPLVKETQWIAVAKAVKTRSPKQCWLYYRRMVQSRTAWNPSEYHRLFHLVTKFTSSETPTFWSQVSEGFLIHSADHTPSDSNCRMYWLRMANRVTELEWHEEEIRMMEEGLGKFAEPGPNELASLLRHELEEARWSFVTEYAKAARPELSGRHAKRPLDYRIKAYFLAHPDLVKVLAPPQCWQRVEGENGDTAESETLKWAKPSSY